jgi:hypothetical protein
MHAHIMSEQITPKTNFWIAVQHTTFLDNHHWGMILFDVVVNEMIIVVVFAVVSAAASAPANVVVVVDDDQSSFFQVLHI